MRSIRIVESLCDDGRKSSTVEQSTGSAGLRVRRRGPTDRCWGKLGGMGSLFAGKVLKKKREGSRRAFHFGLQEPALFIVEEFRHLGMRKRNVGGNSPVRIHQIPKIRTGERAQEKRELGTANVFVLQVLFNSERSTSPKTATC